MYLKYMVGLGLGPILGYLLNLPVRAILLTATVSHRGLPQISEVLYNPITFPTQPFANSRTVSIPSYLSNSNYPTPGIIRDRPPKWFIFSKPPASFLLVDIGCTTFPTANCWCFIPIIHRSLETLHDPPPFCRHVWRHVWRKIRHDSFSLREGRCVQGPKPGGLMISLQIHA